MRKSNGFTLMEIIVALSILTISVTVAMQVFSRGLKDIQRIDAAHRAMHHAENVMNEILSDQSIRGPAQRSGDLDGDFAYTAQVDYWEEPEQRVTIDVAQVPVYLLSVTVDIHFKNDRYGKIYRTICLKAISNQAQDPSQSPAQAIRQLFGNRQ